MGIISLLITRFTFVNLVQSHESLHIMSMTSSTLADVLRAASDMAQLSRDLSTNHIPGLISALLALKYHVSIQFTTYEIIMY